MGAAVAECGRSLSAWAGVQHTAAAVVSPERVQRERFQQIGAGWLESLYFVCAAHTRVRSCLRVGQPSSATASWKRMRPLAETSSSQGESSTW